jgi:hypothetical protein
MNKKCKLLEMEKGHGNSENLGEVLEGRKIILVAKNGKEQRLGGDRKYA